MQWKFNWNSFPKYTIDIGDLSAPIEVVYFFKKYAIDKYVYRIMFKGIVLKFGMSAPESSTRDWGERVYRQIGHCAKIGRAHV